jgi:L-lactate dehydrogenase complex protein LldF
MITAFRRRVRAAIADRNLQQALDNNAERRRQARSQGYASLEDLEGIKAEAREIREATLARLPQLIDEFAARARANGMTVHHAADAEQACRIVLDIARAHRARLLAKSKSMLSEEVGLNHSLEAAGLRVVETDLGEYIVQLRGEPPAHIITPAIHLRREDVARTFVEHLGMAYTTDVAAMTATARRVLRQVFLTCDIGISGANFGVAETGTLCLVTNEGNGRMVTTLPPVHIALVGVERLVPRLADLGPLLALLPRSATGQRISSYVSLIQAPRAAEDADGPSERHVILVDNGRTAISQGILAESLLCVRCGACLNVCPVYREAGGHAYASPYPGPIGSVVSPGLFGVHAFGHLAKASSLCGACKEACPIGIDLPGMLLRLRGLSADAGEQPAAMGWAMRTFAWATATPARLLQLQSLGATAFHLLPLRNSWVRWLPPPLSAWTSSRDFPPLARATFHRRWEDLQRGSAEPGFPGPELVVSPMPTAKTMTRTPPPPPLEPSSAVSLIAKFRERIEEVGGEVHVCAPESASATIQRILKDLGATSVLLAVEPELRVFGLTRSLEENGIRCLAPSLPADGDARSAALPPLDAADAGVCIAAAALADTGTVIVGSGPQGGLLSSLMPPACIVILPPDRMHTGLADWLRGEGVRQVESHRSLSLITGPSRTADIEMTLTMGVHGPGRLIVVCMEAGEGRASART